MYILENELVVTVAKVTLVHALLLGIYVIRPDDMPACPFKAHAH